MQSVAQAWLVLELTNSPFRLGLVGTLQFAPMLVLSFFAGALADRLPKRRLVMVSQSVLFAQALLLAVLVQFGHVQYWHVAVLALLYGVANTVDMPTRQAFIVEMVGRDDLMNAIALNSAMFNAARIVGPALAGFAIAHWGTPLAFFVNALSFLPVLVILAVIRAEGTPRAHGPLDGRGDPRGHPLRGAHAARGADHGHGAGRRRLPLQLQRAGAALRTRRAGSGRRRLRPADGHPRRGRRRRRRRAGGAGPRAAIRHRAGRARAGALRVHRAPGGAAQRAGGGARAVRDGILRHPVHGRLQLDRAAHRARRAARTRDEPAHARLRRQHAVRRLPHRVGGRGGGGDHGAARGGRGRAALGAGAAAVVERSRSRAVAGGAEPGGRTRMTLAAGCT